MHDNISYNLLKILALSIKTYRGLKQYKIRLKGMDLEMEL